MPDRSDKKRILIGGCGRSGTTLLLKLMKAFESTFTVGSEAELRKFYELEDVVQKNIVIKRKSIGRFELFLLPESIGIIYCVRHPFSVLTSKLPHKNERDRKCSEYYISVRRWISEYNSYNMLRRYQPEREISIVRYEDLISRCDHVQNELASNLGLEIRVPFSAVKGKRTGEMGNLGDEVRNRILSEPEGKLVQKVNPDKWRTDERKMEYLNRFPNEIRRELVSFCDEFDYDLPDGYISKDTRLTLLD